MRRTLVVVAAAAVVVAMLASASHAQGPAPSVRRPEATSPLLTKAIAAQTDHARAWRNAPGIVGSGVGLTPAGRPVIRVFTTRPGVSIPKTVAGVRVQPIVTGMILARSATARYPRPVPIGVSAGHFELATGTLGARVTNGANVYALSNNHVFAGGNMATIGDAILQPGPIEDNGSDPADRIGTLADFQEIDFSGANNTIDAAIALTTPNDVGTATLPDGYGAPSSTTVSASVGLPVQKYGRTTGLTTSSINAVNVDVDVCYFPLTPQICLEQAHFVNQFSIPDPSPSSLFSDAGDSGSLVVTTGSNNPVGLMFAGGDGLTIANPIDPVLQRFNVTIDSGAPSDGKPSAPFGLQATAGDGQVALSWNAPASDGGSPITEYKIYRSTSSGTETQISTSPPTIMGTTYTDTTAANGTTHYYKVRATNAVGDGPLSAEASATPIAAVPPTTPLTVVDTFNRANETLSDGGRWTNGIVGGSETGLTVSSNALACTFTTTCTAWRNSTQFGADAEAYTTITTLPGDANAVRLYLRLQTPGSGAVNGYMLLFSQSAASADSVLIYRVTSSGLTGLKTFSQEFAAGDKLLFRAKGSVLEAWRFDSSTWSRLGFVTDSTYSAGGYAGIGLRGTSGRLDDFGARTLGGATAPTAPQNLQANAGNGQVGLTWSAPASDGGSQITGYRVYRGTSPNPTTALTPDLGVATSFQDSGLTNGQTYYYKVSALNAVGESPLSNQASATPVVVTPPAPLSIVDTFNRANETLSDGGRWTNGIVGGSETGLTVSSNTLACTFTTTCTAWRNNAQYGADAESYATISTLPGAGNAVRLYLRLQTPGSATVDGYMLLFSQATGTDSVLIYRITNGGLTGILTVGQEFATGDRLLFRAQGSTLEAWRNDGTTWSRIGFVSDTTYPNAGYAGVGLRGTTGRLDDFGARTLGAAPPTVSDPPTNLSATAGTNQVTLNWTLPVSNGGSAISGYKIYRGTSPGGEGASAIATASGATTSTYTDTTATAGPTYYYKVTAANGVGESTASNEANATPTAAPTVSDPPTNLSATAGTNQVTLNWTLPVSNGGSAISGYKIYRGTSPGGEGASAIATASGATTSTYTDTTATAGPTYYYKVTAANGVGESTASNEANATPTAAPTVSDPPTNLSATAGTNQVTLNWTLPVSNGGSAISGYKIYRGTSPGGEGASAIATASGATTSTYTDTTATAGPTYYYKVTAANGVGESTASNEANATPTAAPTVSDPPTNLSATAGTNQVTLNWTLPVSNGGSAISGYKIYRGTSPGGEGASAIATASGATTSTYTDTTATAGPTYYYKVTAANGVGESTASNEANATPTAAPTVSDPPTNLSATAGTNQVTLNWTLPVSNGGSAISGYKIYRGTSPGGEGASAIATASGATTSTYTDTTATAGPTYYYKVTAANGVGESTASNEANATPNDLVPPVEPLTILDTFNRSNENPLSFGSRWGNGIVGSSERSLRVVSNQCASNQTTTATAWWRTQLAANEEAYATIATLPGNGNAVRLYVRLRTPGSAAVDGYMLLYSQSSGTDQIIIYRITNSGLAQISTASREIAAGNRLLLRAKGTTLEAWVRRGRPGRASAASPTRPTPVPATRVSGSAARRVASTTSARGKAAETQVGLMAAATPSSTLAPGPGGSAARSSLITSLLPVIVTACRLRSTRSR